MVNGKRKIASVQQAGATTEASRVQNVKVVFGGTAVVGVL
jgi:hypothetical protein